MPQRGFLLSPSFPVDIKKKKETLSFALSLLRCTRIRLSADKRAWKEMEGKGSRLNYDHVAPVRITRAKWAPTLSAEHFAHRAGSCSSVEMITKRDVRS